MMPITLRQLQVFLAVARNENLSAAATTLCMSKSAVSQAITELETRLNVTLFERTRGRLLLSSEGRRLMPIADEMILRTNDIGHIFSARTDGQLRVAVTLSVGNFILADLLSTFQETCGWLPEMTIANTRDVAEGLLSFSTDIALVEGPIVNPDIRMEPWIDDEMVVVAHKGHPLTLLPCASWEQLSKERWILRERGSSTRSFFDMRLGLRLTNPTVIADINSFDAIASMVVQGMGLTFISKRILKTPFYAPYLSQVRCPDRFYREFNFCSHRAKYISSDLQTWKNFCIDWAKRDAE